MNEQETRSLIDSTNIVDYISRHVDIKKKGSEHVGLCPFHDEKSPSFSVNEKKQIFKCFGCGEGGDVVDFIIKMGIADTFPAALEELKRQNGEVIQPIKRASKKKEKQPVWKQIEPDPETEQPTSFTHYRNGEPSKVYTYAREDGLPIGYVCRFELEGGKKEARPYVYATNGQRSEWRWLGFSHPRPLYGRENDAGLPVLLVEGEKTADAARELFKKNDVYTWIGGAQSVHTVDWSPLYGRTIIYLPDNDVDGIIAMMGGFRTNEATGKREWKDGIYQQLKEKCPKHRIIVPEDHRAPKWDVADEPEWTSEYAREWAKSRMTTVEDFMSKSELHQPDEDDTPPMPEYEQTVTYAEPINEDETPFRCLGYAKNEGGQNEFFVYSSKARQALKFSAGSLTKSGLMQLATTNFWEMRFVSKQKGFDVDAASEFIMDRCYKLGVYDPDNLRGIGAWIDGKDVVIHTGDKLIVNGRHKPLDGLKSVYIYEANRPFGFELKKPLGLREANDLIKLFEMLSWEKPVNAYLFAGWCIIAPVCGALPWRPHIWLTGGAGTGKSTVFQIIRTVMGKMALAVQGNTTEAGIRQELGQDARPVIFDELDSDSRNDADRIQSILSLVRSSSTFDGGRIIKGGSSGMNRSYVIRSCFAFASITPQVSNTADKSRVTILSLKRENDEDFRRENWVKIQSEVARIIKPEWCESLQARTIDMLPTILENARIFTRAAAAHLGEQRAGDQLGMLLAGAYSLFSNKVIDYDSALKWVAEREWTDIKSDERDEITLFNTIFGQTVQAGTKAGTRVDKTIGELVQMSVLSDNYDPQAELLTPNDADANLRRMGIKVEGDRVIIANKSGWLDRTLMGTAWAKGHSKVLARLPGADQLAATTFASGIKCRAVSLHVDMVINGVEA